MSDSSAHALPATVLIVDDQPRNLEIAQAALSSEGFEIMTATGGQQALQRVAMRTPDLILLDVLMPEMDGFEVCVRIKKNPATHDIPVIFLSGVADHQSITTGFDLGGVDYVTKPFNKAELQARVRTHVELRRAQQRHAAQLLEKNRTLTLIAQDWHKPMQRIALLASQAENAQNAVPPESTNVLVSEISVESERMLASVENFLQRQAADTGNSTTHFPLAWLTSDDLKGIVGRWYVAAMRKRIDLFVSAPPDALPIASSAFSVNQIVDAILSNAVNFTPGDKRVAARIFQSGDDVCLEVVDEGPGFPSEGANLEGMAAAPVWGAWSAGIGLAAAKRAADRVGAKLTIENRLQGGAKVTVEFPGVKAAKAERIPALA